MAGRRRAPRHRAERPPSRWGRGLAVCAAAVVTGLTIVAGVGLLPSGGSDPAVADEPRTPSVRTDPSPPEPRSSPSHTGATEVAAPVDPLALPAESGSGRRIVFDQTRQRVWLVEAGRGGRDRVRRTYLVSGSLTDNLAPGSYAVYSRSRDAVGIDDSGTMRWMVRFAHGPRAPIGFHDIPVHQGRRVQTRAELGTPQSHGCVRQATPDAKALWRFADHGTPVVVIG